MNAIPIDAISPTVVNLLVSLLTKALEGSAKKWGEKIFEIVKERLSKKPSGEEAVNDFENDPNDKDFQAALRIQLKKALQDDEDFRQELGKTIAKISTNKNGANFLQQLGGDNAKQFGHVTGSTIVIDERHAKAEAKVGKSANVKGDVRAIVYYSPNNDSGIDEGNITNGDTTKQ